MAQRPVFIPQSEGLSLVCTKYVEFSWFPGLSFSQKQKSIQSLHVEACKLSDVQQVLEVSSKSSDQIGNNLSAFNLRFYSPASRQALSVECAFQGSKVFETAGPFTDIFEMTSLEAKQDPRLRTSGRLTGFRFLNTDWPLEPATAFYDWMYISALRQKPDLVRRVGAYSAFTDIEFNPQKSINCQAYSVALFCALQQRGLLEGALSSEEAFLRSVTNSMSSNAHQADERQGNLL